jgi:hypothetical protein
MLNAGLFFCLAACSGQAREPIDSSSQGPDSPTPEETGSDAPRHCDTWSSPETIGVIQDSSLEEISGLVISQQNPGVMWVQEDSGAGAILTALDFSGATLGTLQLTGVINQDWEDLAIGPCETGTCLWVGDIGDNGNTRENVSILSTPEPVLEGLKAFSLEATASIYQFNYPEGPQDAEALVVDPAGLPYVLTKRTDQKSRVYQIPREAYGTATLLGELKTGPFAGLPTATTAADLWDDGQRLIVRGYLYSFQVVLEAGDMKSVTQGLATQVTTGLEKQGEAIAYDSQNRSIFHISEGVNPSIWQIKCDTESAK